MKKIFYSSIILFLLLELAINYLLMPFPGSQKLNSLKLIYFLYQNKVYFEIILSCLICVSFIYVFKEKKKLVPFLSIVVLLVVYYETNYVYTAEIIFKQPTKLYFKTGKPKNAEMDRMLIVIENNGEVKAYPVSYLSYHHQILDSIGGKKIMLSYCGLCQTARIYDPYIKGVYTKFRLVGINHYNAMFEDIPTKSWWSQQTGECIAGKLKGQELTVLNHRRMSLKKCLELHPDVKIMQADPILSSRYVDYELYEPNANSNPRIMNASQDWNPKTFVIGIADEYNAKAYEWEYLKKVKLINDKIGDKKIFIALSKDEKSVVAFQNTSSTSASLHNDTIVLNNVLYDMDGVNLITKKSELSAINAHRQYWFSWKYAHPTTAQQLHKK